MKLSYKIQIEGLDRLFEKSLEIKEGLTVLYGANGSGKSMTLEALMFALYGSKALRGSTKDYTLFDVQLELEDILVKRSLRDAQLFVNGDLKAVKQEAVTEACVTLTGLSLDEFKTRSYLSYGSGSGITSMTPSELKKYFQKLTKTSELSEFDKVITSCLQDKRAVLKYLEGRMLDEPVVIQEPEKIPEGLEERIYSFVAELETLQRLPDIPKPSKVLRGFTPNEIREAKNLESKIVVSRALVERLQKSLPEYMEKPDEVDEEFLKFLEYQEAFIEENKAVFEVSLPAPSIKEKDLDDYIQQWKEYEKAPKFSEESLTEYNKHSDQYLKVRYWVNELIFTKSQLQEFFSEEVDNVLSTRSDLRNKEKVTCPSCKAQFIPGATEGTTSLVEKYKDLSNEELSALSKIFPILEVKSFTRETLQNFIFCHEMYNRSSGQVYNPKAPSVSVDEISKARDWYKLEQIRGRVLDAQESLKGKDLVKMRRDLANKKLYEDWLELLEAKEQLKSSEESLEVASSLMESNNVWNVYLAQKDREASIKDELSMLPSREDLRNLKEALSKYKAYLVEKERYEKDKEKLAEARNEFESVKEIQNICRDVIEEVAKVTIPHLLSKSSEVIQKATSGSLKMLSIDDDFVLHVDGRKATGLSQSEKVCLDIAIQTNIPRFLGGTPLKIFLGDELNASLDPNRRKAFQEVVDFVKTAVDRIILISHDDSLVSDNAIYF